MTDTQKLVKFLGSTADDLELRGGFGPHVRTCRQAKELIEQQAARIAALEAEVERLTTIASMVELRSLMVARDDKDDVVAKNLIAVRDHFIALGDEDSAKHAVATQDALSLTHRLVTELTARLSPLLTVAQELLRDANKDPSNA